MTMKAASLWGVGFVIAGLARMVWLVSSPPDYAAKPSNALEFTSASGLTFPSGTRFIKYYRDDYFVGSERSYYMKAFVPTAKVGEFMGQAALAKAQRNLSPYRLSEPGYLHDWSQGETGRWRTMEVSLPRHDNLTDVLAIGIVDKPAGIDVYLDCENFSLVDRSPATKRPSSGDRKGDPDGGGRSVRQPAPPSR